MNYYEHHLGDYKKDAAHLTMLQEGAYRRLIDAYYAREAPLPVAKQLLYQLAGAHSAPERKAVDFVVEQFFKHDREAAVYRQSRCDEEIERYREGEPEREAKRESDRERQRRARARRSQLFAALRELGQVPRFDASTADLERLLSRTKGANGHASVTASVTPVTCDNTATIPSPHSPVPISQSPPSESGGGGNRKRFRTADEILAEEAAHAAR